MRTLELLLATWCEAEAGGDAAALDPLLAAEFLGDGPLGFVLDKRRWLDRHRLGDLTVASFGWVARDVRVFHRTAVATGVRSQVASYRGRDCSGALACTLVAVRRQGGWAIVNLQLGGQPPGPESWPPGRCSWPAAGPSTRGRRPSRGSRPGR